MTDVPGPRLGWTEQLRRVRRDFLGFLVECSDSHDELFCIRPGPTTRIWVLKSAELAHEVLTTRAAEFTKSAQTRFMVGKFLGNGLVLSDGDVHRAQRRLLQGSFGPREVQAIAPKIVASTIDASRAWAEDGIIDVEPAMTALSLRVIVTFLTGDDLLESSRGSVDGDVFGELATAIGGRFRSLPLPSWIPTARNRREHRAIQRVDELVDSLLASCADRDSGRGVLRKLAVALAAGEMDRREVRDHLVTLLFAGHETVAKLLTWSLYLLALHPAVAATLRRELDEVVGDRDVEPADFQRLHFLNGVLKESMRLYPPVWVFDRSPRQPLQLGGHRLKPKDIVYVSPYLLQRQARYFPEPLTFKPERFVEGLEGRLPPGAYFPFGGGARSCIGQALGYGEAALALATLVRRFDFSVDAAAPPLLPKPDATLAPNGPLRLQVRARS